MIDIITVLAAALFIYLLSKHKDRISSSLSEKINAALKSAEKFLTFIVAAFGFAFVVGEFYGVSFVGYIPDNFLFWLPVYVEVFLILYYYLG